MSHTKKFPKTVGRELPGAKIHRRGAVRVGCTEKGCRGVMWSVALSRLEESLGHCGYQCDTCGLRIKTVPQQGGE